MIVKLMFAQTPVLCASPSQKFNVFKKYGYFDNMCSLFHYVLQKTKIETLEENLGSA